MSFGAGAKSFPPHAIRMTCDVPGGPIEAPDTGYPIGRPGVVMHFTSMRTNPIRPHRAMTAHQPFAHSHAPDPPTMPTPSIGDGREGRWIGTRRRQDRYGLGQDDLSENLQCRSHTAHQTIHADEWHWHSGCRIAGGWWRSDASWNPRAMLEAASGA